MKTLLAIIFLFSINISHSAETQKGLGKILVPKKSLNLPYEYYVTIQKSDGQVLAFPLKSKSVKLSQLKSLLPIQRNSPLGKKPKILQSFNSQKRRP
jgi:hypothetical protein